MKQFIRIVAMLLVLLMTVSVFVACGNKDKEIEKDDKDQGEKESEREQETEQQLTKEEIDQLKADMSASILEALDQMEQVTTEGETEKDPSGGNSGIVEGLLGSLGGLGGSGSDYSQIIGDILDQYLGSESTSDFILQLIRKWFENQSGGSSWFPSKDTQDTTAETEESLPEPESLREFVAQQTAKAIADAIMDQISDMNGNGDVHDTIYDSVYDAMMKDDNYMDGALNESFPGLGDLNGDANEEWESIWGDIMDGVPKDNPFDTAEQDPGDFFDNLFGGLTQ